MALAFDTAAQLTLTPSGSSNTTAYTVGSASGRLLLVWTLLTNGDDLFTVTYNGVPMTLLRKLAEPGGGGVWNYLHAYPGAPSGTHNIVQTTFGTGLIFGVGASYTGVFAVDASASDTATAVSSFALNLTTGVANCWTAAICRQTSGGPPTDGAGTTSRLSNATGGYDWADSNGLLPAGATSLNFNADTGTPDFVGIIVSMQEVGGGATTWPGYIGPFGWQ